MELKTKEAAWIAFDLWWLCVWHGFCVILFIHFNMEFVACLLGLFWRLRHSSFTFICWLVFFYCLSLFMFNIFFNFIYKCFKCFYFCTCICIYFNLNLTCEINSHYVDGSVVWNKCFHFCSRKKNRLPCNFSCVCLIVWLK